MPETVCGSVMRHRNSDLDSKSREEEQMIIKCEKGKHYYETERHTSCPFCMKLREISTPSLQTKENSAESMTETETLLKSDRKKTGYHV